MEFKELKDKKQSELQTMLFDAREKLRELRFKDAGKQLKQVNLIKSVRVEIAQILTAMNALRKVREEAK